MQKQNIWNIQIKLLNTNIYLNSSLFFFFILPLVIYLKEDKSNLVYFIASYYLIFLVFISYRLLFSIKKKQDIKIYPFGVLKINKTDIKNSFLENFFYFYFEPIFLIFSSYFLYSNNILSPSYIYPLIILLCSIFSFLCEKNIVSQKFSFYTISVLFLILSFKITDFAFIILFLSFINSSFFSKEIEIYDDFGKEYFVREIMTKKDDMIILSPTSRVDEVIDDIIKTHQSFFPVVINDKIVGILRKEEIVISFKTSIDGDYQLIEEIMHDTKDFLSPDSNLIKAKEAFESNNFKLSCLPVVQDGKFLGLLVYEFLVEYVSIKKLLFKIKMFK